MRVEGLVTHFLVDLDTHMDKFGVAIWFVDMNDGKKTFETRHTDNGHCLVIHHVEGYEEDQELGVIESFELDSNGVFASVNIDGVEHILWGTINSGDEIFLDTEPNYRKDIGQYSIDEEV